MSGLALRLRRRASEPAWAQIEVQLAERIESGELRPGERLPPERALAQSLDVSRMTVRQALDALARRGLLERGVGRGTFVRAPARSFSDRLGDAEARVLLAREEGAELRVRRVRVSDGRPVALEDVRLPAERFPELLTRDLTGSLYELMRSYGLEPVRVRERIAAVPAGEEEARALELRAGAPVMLVERVGYTAGDEAVEHAREHHRGAFVVERR
jgi:GntR family transcriptional regulator